MLRTRAEVDRHVQNTLAALKTPKEKKLRGYSIARLYFDIGDYQTCVQYATKYLSVKNDNAAAHNLLGQAYAKLGDNERAMAEFKTSLELDPNQPNLIIKVCELLADERLTVDSGVVRYWVDRARSAFPNHPAVFRLSHRRLQLERADPAAYVALLKEQVASRPSDPSLHSRLLRQLVGCDRADEAYRRAMDVRFADDANFRDSLLWQETAVEVSKAHRTGIMKESPLNICNYWIFYLTALERKAFIHLGWKYSHVEAADAVKELDGALYEAAQCEKLDSSHDLFKHFGSQLCMHGGILLLKRALSDQSGWYDVINSAAPLFLLAYQMHSPNLNLADDSWTAIGAFRKSQSGHALFAFAKSRKGNIFDSILQFCTGKQWRNKLYKALFLNKNQSPKISSSFLLESNLIQDPILKLPNVEELYEFDLHAMSFLPDSLHHQIWIGMHLDKLSKISSKIDFLPCSIDNLSNCGPETLGNHDIDTFLYCAVLISQYKNKNTKTTRVASERPQILPAILMEPLCTVEQAKWWEYAKQLSQNDFNSQNTDMRLTITRGIECVRCVVNHGLDPYILTHLGRIFAQRADKELAQKHVLIKRAALYYSAALPLLEKPRGAVEMPKKRLFNFSSQDVTAETASFLEECKLFLGKYYMEAEDTDRAVEMLKNVKSPYGSFYLYKIYMKLANGQSDNKNYSNTPVTSQQRRIFLSKARDYIYMTSSRLKDSNATSDHPLYEGLTENVENVEHSFSTVNFDNSISKNTTATEYFSDDQSLTGDVEPIVESTPNKYNDVSISSNFRSLEAQVWQLQRKESLFGSALEQIGTLLESNKLLTDEVKDFKTLLEEMKSQNMKFFSSLEEIHGKVDDLREESVSKISDLKKDVVDLRREFGKLKLSSNSQPRNDEDIYLAEEQYRAQVPCVPRLPNNTPAIPPHLYSMYAHAGFNPFYSGQYPTMPQLFPTHMLPTEQPLYPELLLSNQIGGTQAVPPPMIPSLIGMQNTLHNQIAANLTSAQTGIAQNTAAQVLPQPQIIPTAQSLSQGTSLITGGQPVVHDYQIPLPNNIQPVPQFLFNQQTSTPNKPPLDSSNPVITSKPFDLFDGQKASTATTESSNTLSIFGSQGLNSSLENSSLNLVKTRSVSEKSDEAYDPYPDYKPVVPLPDEIIPVTGEENETVLFNERAKLFRFLSGEWKERGLGQLKLLKDNENGKVRLLMRRETVHTICANHFITPELELSLMKGTDKGYLWVANDFADEVVKLEKLCVKFKTCDIGKNFYNVFNSCRDLYKESPDKNKNSNVDHKDNQLIKNVDLDKKSWKCTGCSTMNNSSCDRCTICETALSNENSGKPSPLSVGGLTFTSPPSIKPIQETNITPATTAESSKPNPFAGFLFSKPAVTFSPTVTSSNKDITTDKTKTSQAPVEPISSGWGDKFKPKAGSWTCNACYLNNDGSNNYCVSCDNPKDPSMPKKEKSLGDLGGQKFKFGIGGATTNEEVSPFAFKFGITNPNLSTQKPESKVIINNTENKNQDQSENKNETVCTFGFMKNEKHDFIFKPKTPSTAKSPNKSCENNAENDENEYAQEDEGHHIFFEPLIPLPDKVEVKTGEEDDIVLYSHRSKLYRFAEAEWKECGVGDIKILQNKITNKIRVLMRREPILKLCLNHALTLDVEYTQKDEKSWLFSANDFSTEEVCFQQFCIRFGNPDIAKKFKAAVDNAKKILEGGVSNGKNDVSILEKSLTSVNIGKADDDVTFISETMVSEEEIRQARKLMLPDKFYAYKQLPSCSGCVGCQLFDNYDRKILNTEISITPKKPVFGDQPKFNQDTFLKAIQQNDNKSQSDNKESDRKESIFGQKFTVPQTTPSIFGGTGSALASGISLANASPVFGSKSVFGTGIFGSNAQNSFKAPSIINNTPEKGPNFAQPSVFGGNSEVKSPQFSLQNIFPAENKPIPTIFNTSYNFTWKKDTPANETKEEKELGQGFIRAENDINNSHTEEESEVFFKPVTPLPDAVDVKTGEENETVLYSHRAKIYRFADSEFKECGIGDVKILCHCLTKKLRVLMRSASTKKICLNHWLTSEIQYLPKDKDEKSWLFHASDFSTEEVLHRQFCIRFANKETAAQFKTAIDNALRSYPQAIEKSDDSKTDDSQSENAKVFCGLTPPKLVVSENAPTGYNKEKESTDSIKPVNSLFNAKPFYYVGGPNSTTSIIPSLSAAPIFNNSLISSENTKTFSFGGLAETFQSVTEAKTGENYFTAAVEKIAPLGNQAENQKKENIPFKWTGAGTPLFSSGMKNSEGKTNEGENTEYDPHYEPIVPMPDEIVVVTGEEDEVIIFNNKGKLFRFTDNEWKERGNGDMKILHHPERGTHRMLLRQNQVHKLVLNQLIDPELKFLPMNDLRSYIWAGLNYIEDESGVVEKLAIRFRNTGIASDFKSKIDSIQMGLRNSNNIDGSESSFEKSIFNTKDSGENKPKDGQYSFNGESKS